MRLNAITAFRHARPKIDLRRTLANTVITTYGDDFATASTPSSPSATPVAAGGRVRRGCGRRWAGAW